MKQQVAIENREIVGSRLVPFSGLSITATTEGGAQTFATANGQGAMLVERLAVVNTSIMVATLSLHAVPDGGGISDDTAQIVGMTIAANDAVDLTDLIGGFYAPGTTLKVWSGTDGALTLSGYWKDVF